MTKQHLPTWHPVSLARRAKFPKIHRSITDVRIWAAIITCIIFVLLLFALFDLFNAIKQKEWVKKEREAVISQVQYWQSVVKKYPDYRDGYYTLAVLSYRLKDIEYARGYLKKALELDPNFIEGRELEKKLRQ